jgi:putative oxidoreductase
LPAEGFPAESFPSMEAVGGVLLVLGIQTRAVALALIPVLMGALWVHSGNGWEFSCQQPHLAT